MTPYAGTDYAPALQRFKAEFIRDGRKGFPAERIGEAIYLALTAAKPEARYAMATAQIHELDVADAAAET